MQNFSTTQASNLTAIVGVIVMILNHFNINVGNEELMAVIGAGITIFGIVMNWYHRFSKGDVRLSGFRK